MSNYQGGYSCEFAEELPTSTQSECPVCLLVLREPYQVNCCGYAFCQVCIERIQKNNKPCPCCNTERFDTFEDKRLKRSLYAFKVHCSNSQQGCQWVGELGQLDNHLNLNPEQHNQLQGCQLSQIKCLHCSQLFLRSDIQAHQNNQCPRRPFSCQYCKDFDSCYKEVTTNHWPVCGSYPMPCTNNCGETLQRQNLDNHIANDCPLTIIDCDFQHVGCKVRLPRKDMPEHLEENQISHMAMNVAYLEEENKQLKKRVAEFEKHISAPAKMLIINNFSQRLKNKDRWLSPTFYSHPHGYKMRMIVTVGGTNIVTLLLIQEGEYDSDLRWPFEGSVTLTLVGADNNLYVHVMLCNNRTSIDGEPLRGGTSKCVYGTSLMRNSLISKYIIADSLYLKVSDIAAVLLPE